MYYDGNKTTVHMKIPKFIFLRLGAAPSIVQMPILGASKALVSAPPIFMEVVRKLLKGGPVRIDTKEMILIRPNFFLKNKIIQENFLSVMVNCAQEGEFSFIFIGEEEQLIPYAEKFRSKCKKEDIYFHTPSSSDEFCMISRRATSRDQYIYEVRPAIKETLVGLN